MTRDSGRPDPDALLAAVQREEKPAGRGRLKIFFGFSPGVGKTYAMLEAARRLRANGVDVVAGIVETHGREETARLLEGLAELPRLDVPYRGHVLREFDLDAALRRNPAILLVDELAHTNAPGLRHEKRWQDVFELLARGIDVHTTLNVQHVESVVDLVEEATGIRVRETVPDTVLERADEIELIDLPPDELLSRLRAGKIYLPEVAREAVERFFRRPNLLQLRELALVRMARLAGHDAATDRVAARRGGGATERLVVGVGAGRGSARAIRDAARIAAGLRADWTAVTVRMPHARPPQVAASAAVEANLTLAESLGGTVERVAGPSVAAGLVAEARRRGATRIVVGRPQARAWTRLFRSSTLDELVRSSGSIDVVVAGNPVADPAERRPEPPAAGETSPGGLVGVSAAVAAVLGLGHLLRPLVDDHVMSLLALVIVVAASLRFGRVAGILAAVLAAVGIDVLFIHPEFQLTVSDSKEIISLLVLLLAGLVIAELLMRVRTQREFAIAAGQRLTRLLELSGRLATATDAGQAAAAVAATVADVTGAGVDVVLATPTGELASAARRGDVEQDPGDAGVMVWCHEFGQPAGRGTSTLPGARITCLPIREAGHAVGVVVILCRPPRPLSRDELDMVVSAVNQAAARLVTIEAEQSRPLPASRSGGVV